MSDEQLIIGHLIDLKSGQADLSARMKNVEEAITGKGDNHGLVQRVEGLEASKNRTLGGVAVLGFIGTGIWGLLEYLFHFKRVP